MAPTFKDRCGNLRNSIAILVEQLAAFKDDTNKSEIAQGENRGEVLANITLALRHAEDASMRLGKAIQAHEGGVSPLGGPSTPGQNSAGVSQQNTAEEKAL